MQGTMYGIGCLCAAIMWAEIGPPPPRRPPVRQLRSAVAVCRLDVTCTS